MIVYCHFGIIPRIPISCTPSPLPGSHLPSATTSFHSKLLLVLSETSITMSFVSLPVIFNLPGVKAAVTTQDPAGMGEVAKIGLGTVVAPGGDCPDAVCVKLMGGTFTEVSNAQKPCSLFAFTGIVCVFIVRFLI